MTIANRLTQLRKKASLTQDIAKKLGIHRGTYSNYETGKRVPDYATLKKLADIFGVTTDYLLDRTEIPYLSATINNQMIKLTEEEYKILKEIKKHPKYTEMLHDLSKDSEHKVRKLIKMWEVIREDTER